MKLKLSLRNRNFLSSCVKHFNAKLANVSMNSSSMNVKNEKMKIIKRIEKIFCNSLEERNCFLSV